MLVADSIQAFCNIALIRFYLFQLAFIWDSVFLEQSLVQIRMSREPNSYGGVVDGTSQQFIFQTKWNGKRPEKKGPFLG